MNSNNNNDDIIISSEISSLRRGAVVPIVPFGEQKAEVATDNTPKHPRKRFMAIAATAAAAAAVMVLTYRSPNTVTSIFSTSSSLVGTRTSKNRQQGESCGGYDWADGLCADGLSCFTGGNNNYCVPNAKEWGCCDDGIDCGKGLKCDSFCGCGCSTRTCKIPTDNDDDATTCNYKFVKKGSCNPNTGEPPAANGFVNCNECDKPAGFSNFFR